MVAANILAPVLHARAQGLVAALDQDRRPSFLVLSGILDEQYAALRARYEALGLSEREHRTLDEWTSGCFALE